MFKKLTTGLVLFFVLLMALNVSAWTIQENYDGQNIGQTCGSMNSTQSTVTDIVAFSGTQSCLHRIVGGTTGFGTWGGIINFPSNLVKGDEIWIRIQTFMPTGFDYNSTSGGNLLKFLRVHTRSQTDPNFGYNDWYIVPTTNPFYSHLSIYEGEQRLTYVQDLSLRPQLNVWETYEFYIKLDDVTASTGGEARVRFWKNGQLILDLDRQQTLRFPSAFADRMHIFTFWNGGAPKTQQMYIDDLIITTAQPSNVDAAGNPYIGTSTVTPSPNPPTSLK